MQQARGTESRQGPWRDLLGLTAPDVSVRKRKGKRTEQDGWENRKRYTN